MTGGKAPRLAGDRFERACSDRLRGLGFLVIRSAGSLGPADLVALRGDRVPALIQCKITDNTTVRTRMAFYRVATGAGAVPVLVYRAAQRRGAIWVRVDYAGTRIPYDITEMPEWLG
jgi:Holliday junction resolvase